VRRFFTATALGLCLLPAPLAAQVDQREELNVVFRSVASHWARGNASAVVRLIAPDGVFIDVSDGPMGPLGERQASALLRQLFEQGETVSVHAGMLERVGGEPPRAFGAVTWTTLPRGTRLPVRRTVYFGLRWIDGDWRVSEIRLIP